MPHHDDRAKDNSSLLQPQDPLITKYTIHYQLMHNTISFIPLTLLYTYPSIFAWRTAYSKRRKIKIMELMRRCCFMITCNMDSKQCVIMVYISSIYYIHQSIPELGVRTRNSSL